MSKRALLAVLLLVGSALGIRRLVQPSDDPGARELTNRVWLDGWPQGERDMREVLVILDPPRQPQMRLGSFVRASRWRGAFEAFVYMPPQGGKVAIRYPQSGREELARFRVTRCREDNFDRCLEIEGNSVGVHRYRSNDDLVLRGEGPAALDVGSPAALFERIEAAHK